MASDPNGGILGSVIVVVLTPFYWLKSKLGGSAKPKQ